MSRSGKLYLSLETTPISGLFVNEGGRSGSMSCCVEEPRPMKRRFGLTTPLGKVIGNHHRQRDTGVIGILKGEKIFSWLIQGNMSM